MPSTEKLDTHRKALTVNLDASTFGSFAEIGAGQEVVLHNKAVVLAPGYFGHVDPVHAQIHTQMLAAGIQELRRELGESTSAPIGCFCLSAAPIAAQQSTPEISDLLTRINALLAQGGYVLLFRERELYSMTALVNRYTKASLRFIVGLSPLIRAFDDPYFNLEGRLLEALARLLAQNVRIYAYPMTAIDLEQAIEVFSAIELEWNGMKREVGSPLNSCVSRPLSNTFTPIFSQVVFSFLCTFQQNPLTLRITPLH
jgi:hypothetical protein